MNGQPSLPAPIESEAGVHTPGPDDSLALLESLDLGFDVLSAIDQRVAAAYRVRFGLNGELRSRCEQFDMALTKANADRTWNLPVPATFVIDRDRIVRSAHVDPDYRERMERAEILAAVASVVA